jgi:peptidoglycan/LPS O-acetylase OafA/YrhL
MIQGNLKRLKYFVVSQLILFLGLFGLAVFSALHTNDNRKLLVLIPLGFWILMFIGIYKQKQGCINIGVNLLLLSFVGSGLLLIEEFSYLQLAGFLYFGVFVFVCRRAILLVLSSAKKRSDIEL